MNLRGNLPLLSISLLALSSLSAQAGFVSVHTGESFVQGNSLSGTVTYEGWDQLDTSRISNTNATGGPAAGGPSTRPYGNHNNTAGWYNWVYNAGTSAYEPTTPATISSNLGSGSSSLWKSSGYGYVASSSVHQGLPGFQVVAGGDFTMALSSIADLETIVFQIMATDREGTLLEVGEVFDTMPTLTYGATTLAADYSAIVDTQFGYSTGGFGDQNMVYWGFQWDLSGENIAAGTDVTIDWTGLANSGIFALQLNQGTEFTQVIPEPGAMGLLLFAFSAVMLRRKRRN